MVNILCNFFQYKKRAKKILYKFQNLFCKFDRMLKRMKKSYMKYLQIQRKHAIMLNARWDRTCILFSVAVIAFRIFYSFTHAEYINS